jgi:hypothetical protein
MRWTASPIILKFNKTNFWQSFIDKIILIIIMNKFITIGDEKVSITEIENAKSIPELLQSRVQYAILDQLNDMVARTGMGNPDEVKKLVLRDIAFTRGGYSSSFTFQMANQAVNITEVDFTSEKNISELLTLRVQYAILDQLNHLLSQSDNPDDSLKKIKDSLVLDISKIIDTFTPLKHSDDK